MSITLTALQKQRRDSAANWTAENPTLLAGEIGIESDTGYWKVGDGSTAWTSLAYISGLGAEIPVSRLADGSARQLLQTDAAGTGVEWTSNVDVPGTLDVTSTATFDSIASHPLGSAGAPTITFTGDTNTGIYSPGADQVAISTNGTGRLFVDASGRVLTGTSTSRSQGQALQVEGIDFPTSSFLLTRNQANNVSSVFTFLKTRGTTTGSNTIVQAGDRLGRIEFQGADGTSGSIAAQIEAFADSTPGTGSVPGYFAFSTTASSASAPTERLRITSAGLVGIGTSSPSELLHVNSSGNTKLLVSSTFSGSTDTAVIVDTTGDTSIGALAFRKAGVARGDIAYRHNASAGSERISLNVAGGERLSILGSGNVGIGTTSPGSVIDVRSSGAVPARFYADNFYYVEARGNAGTNGQTGFNSIVADGSGASTNFYCINAGGAGQLLVTNAYPLQFFTNNTERARIDSSGRLLVGTSSARSNFENASESAFFQIEGATSDTRRAAIISSINGVGGAVLILAKQRSGTVGGNTIVNSGDLAGTLSFQGSDGAEFLPAALVQGAIDGTPGANSMPGRLVFSTTADGASSPTERLRITNAGRIGLGQTAPATTVDVNGAQSANVTAVAALNIDCSLGNLFTKTINANSTFTVSNVPASRSYAFTLELTHTSGTITWFSGVVWPGGTAPTLTTGKVHLFMFFTDDSGTTWRASSLINY